VNERGDDDGDLVQALVSGEPNAAHLLIDRHGSRIYRVARRLLDDTRDAEEVTQDVLMTIVREIRTFKGDAAFSSWIYRITANAAYGRLRGRRARSEVSLELLLPVFAEDGHHAQSFTDWSLDTGAAAMAGELRAALEQSLDELPPQYRAVVVLHDVEGLPNEEVAEILDLTLPAVKSRLHRARLFLRKRLGSVFPPRG
jgi:RNA polymerase sigma-70 factor (ECF subfamily)